MRSGNGVMLSNSDLLRESGRGDSSPGIDEWVDASLPSVKSESSSRILSNRFGGCEREAIGGATGPRALMRGPPCERCCDDPFRRRLSKEAV